MATQQLTEQAPAATAPTSTWREDLLCALAGYWLIGGLYLDGWAHTNRPDLETFLTPWHGVLYSGFAALAGCLLAATARRRDPALPPRGWIPAGYGLGLLGIGVFVAGGAFDLAWHQVLGIEVSLEALLSPPHLLLLTGGMLMVTTPLRAVIARHGELPADPGSAPAILALAGTTAGGAFFLSYVSPFTDLPAAAGQRDWPAFGLTEYLVTTALLVVPLLTGYARGRRVPPGTVTAVVAAAALPVGVFTEFRWFAVQVGAVAGGVAADVVVHRVAARAPRLTGPAAGVAVPVLVWAGYLAAVAATTGIGWSVELWAGVVVLTAVQGALLGGLVRPVSPGSPARPG